MKKNCLAASASLFFLTSVFAVDYTWDGGATNDRFNNSGNWDPTGVPSSAGDTGVVGDGFAVEVGASTELELDSGVTITFNGSSTLSRNNSSFAGMSGVFNFNDTTSMTFSDLRLRSGVTLNWNSSGTFNNGSLGLVSQPNFLQEGGTVNMSNGTWTLDSSGADSMIVQGGTFSLTGGSITNLDRFRLESTFNIGGSGELYVADEFMTGSALLDFQSTSAAFYIEGFDENLNARISSGFIAIAGVVQTDASNLVFQNVTVDSTDYTRINAAIIPEPASFAFSAGIIGLAAFVIRRRR